MAAPKPLVAKFYSKRSTPWIQPVGSTKKPKPSWGKFVSSRRLSAEESKKARRGDWIRVDQKGNKPTSSSYKASSYRPKLGTQRKRTNQRLRRQGR